MAAATVGFDDLEKLKVPELRKLCKEHGLTSTGKKEELLQRLKEALQDADDNILEESVEGELVPESTVADDVNEDILNEDLVPENPKPKPQVATKQPLKTQISEGKENGAPPKKIIKISAAVSPPVSPPISPTTDQPKAEGKSLTDEQRLAMRAAKFGISSAEAQKVTRAERFGLAKPASATGSTGSAKLSTAGTTIDVDKLKQRAERFGTVTSKTLQSADVNDRLEKRKERFGVVSPDDKLKKRQERFASAKSTPDAAGDSKPSTNAALEEAKRKRAERFGLNK